MRKLFILLSLFLLAAPANAEKDRFLGFTTMIYGNWGIKFPSRDYEALPEGFLKWVEDENIKLPPNHTVNDDARAFLDLKYKVECPNLNRRLHFPGLNGRVEIRSRKRGTSHYIRFDLPLGTDSIRIPLGHFRKYHDLFLSVHGNEACTLKRKYPVSDPPRQGEHFPSAFHFDHKVNFEFLYSAKLVNFTREEWRAVARLFAPYMVIREDQRYSRSNPSQRFNDIPLGYTFYYQKDQTAEDQWHIYYSAIFSDSNLDEHGVTEDRLEDYGRRMRIHPIHRRTIWVDKYGYVETVDRSTRVYRPAGESHKITSKHEWGRFLGPHPIVYIGSQDFEFSTKPQDDFQTEIRKRQTPPIGYIFDPIVLMSDENATCVPIDQPWMCKVSDAECCREDGTYAFVDQYLFARIDANSGISQMSIKIGQREYGNTVQPTEPMLAFRLGKKRLQDVIDNKVNVSLKLYDKNLDLLYPPKIPIEFFTYVENEDGSYSVKPLDSRSFSLGY